MQEVLYVKKTSYGIELYIGHVIIIFFKLILENLKPDLKPLLYNDNNRTKNLT